MGGLFVPLGLAALAHLPAATAFHGVLPMPAVAPSGAALAASACTVAACLLLSPAPRGRAAS
jgi:hypothetical protein